MNYKKDIEIDFHRLHENWRDHSKSYLEWSEAWANKDEERDLHKRKLRLDIIANPGNYGLKSNPSEASILAAIETDEIYIKLSKDLHVLASVKQAFEHRRASLDGLTRLFAIGYFSLPNLPAEVQKAIKDNVDLEVKQERQTLLRRNPRLSNLAKEKFNENFFNVGGENDRSKSD
jgi:hypothetical protein